MYFIIHDHLLFKRLGFVFCFFGTMLDVSTCVLALTEKRTHVKPWFVDCFAYSLPKDIDPVSVSLLVRGTWQKSRNWSTRPSSCTAGSSIWRSGLCQTAPWRTGSLAIRWPSWAAISCWPMRARDLLSWTTRRYPRQMHIFHLFLPHYVFSLSDECSIGTVIVQLIVFTTVLY